MSNLIFDNGFAQLYHADARSLPIPDNSVDCVVTSPPYWGLRDYGLGKWEGGNEDCQHTVSMPIKWNDPKRGTNYTRPEVAHRGGDSSACFLCGAKRTDGGIGLEPTPEAYCANMVEVFREVWRVLKPTGTVWMNLGDSYAGNNSRASNNGRAGYGNPREGVFPRYGEGLKSKDLVGIPWRVAFALQKDGWYLRSDIIWSKPNPMPESVTDRPTKAHEYIFLLTKSPKYYYDSDAIREPSSTAGDVISLGEKSFAKRQALGANVSPSGNALSDTYVVPNKRNKRTVWEIATQPYPEAHFATFPEDLVEPCILAGSSEKGVCAQCGKPWERTDIIVDRPERTTRDNYIGVIPGRTHASRMNSKAMEKVERQFMGWEPTCTCNADVVPATVLDPFAGSGTTLAVAQKFGRKSVGTDLSMEYLELAAKRISRIPFPLIG